MMAANGMVMQQTIYINGVKRRATHLGAGMFVDAAGHEGVPCSQHSLTQAAVAHLQASGRVYTSGKWYSLHPDAPQAALVKPQTRLARKTMRIRIAQSLRKLARKIEG